MAITDWLAVLAVALFWGSWFAPAAVSKSDLLRSLDATAQAGGRADHLRVAIGWNTNLDLIVPAVPLLVALGLAPPAAPAASSADEERVATQQLSSREALSETFAYFFDKGVAAERFVEDSVLFDALVAAADGIEGRRYSTGGNAALMSNRLATEGCDVLLGGTVGTKLKGLIHPKIRTVQEGGAAAGAGAMFQKDEVHMILEFQKGEVWGSGATRVVAPRANRFIVTRDESNARVAGLEPMAARLGGLGTGDAAPHVFVASGVNQMEGLAAGAEREGRLRAVSESLRSMSVEGGSFPVHLELASIADER
jgi:ADP-dependent glucokinase